jgi:hypothetical protein
MPHTQCDEVPAVDKLSPDKADNLANRTGVLRGNEMSPHMSALGHKRTSPHI